MQNQAMMTEQETSSRRRRIWKRIAGGMACIVVFVTTYMLILPAITMEENVYCGMEEHIHQEDCFETSLICGMEEVSHVHTEDCYTQEQELICQQSHTHGEECYATKQVLTCGISEAESHVHTEDCYTQEQELICQQSHTHGEECYATKQVLTCGVSEAEPHVHTEDCYQQVLICGKEEHQHELACYSDPAADVEGQTAWELSFSNVALTGEPGTDVLSIAKSQLGYQESTRNYAVTQEGELRGYTRYGAWYGDPFGDWNTLFAAFCLHYAGVEKLPMEADCQDWVEALREAALYAQSAEHLPGPGDLVFFDKDADGAADRVGIVEELVETTVIVIEGASGKAVTQTEYKLTDSTILGYGLYPEVLTTDKTAVIYTDSSFTLPAEDSTVIALTGQLPEEREVRAVPVTVETEADLLCAYDLSMAVPEGVQQGFTVSIQSPELQGESGELAVYRLLGNPQRIASETLPDGVRFEADSLGAYVVLRISTPESTENHVHTEACISTLQILTCEDRSAEHVHTQDCYQSEGLYTCGCTETAEQKNFQKTVVTDDCSVTVTYSPEAEIPEEAELVVSAYLPGTAEYEAQYSRFRTVYAEWVGEEAPSLEFLRFFRVEFLMNGEQIEPQAEISVRFAFPETKLPSKCAVIHYAAEETELLTQPEVEVEEQAVCFWLKSFSELALLGDEALPELASTNWEFTSFAMTGNTSLTVNMVWEDGNQAHDGESVIVTLYNNDISTGQTLVLNADNQWTGTFEGLSDDGVYTVRETVPTGWYAETSREESKTGGTVWIPATGFEADEIYTFVYDTDSTPMAQSSSTSLTAGSVTKGTQTVTVNGETYDDYLTEVPANAQWMAQSTGSSSALQSVGRSGYYLRRSSTSFVIGTSTTNRTIALTARTTGFRVSVGSYYWQAPGTATTSSTSATRFYLYRQVSTPTVTEITYTVTNRQLSGSGGTGTDAEYLVTHEKFIDAFRDNEGNPDTDLDDYATDLSDLYRLYLNAGIKVDMTPVDLLIVVDRSGSMDQTDVPVDNTTVARDKAVTLVLNGSYTQATGDGLIGQFLDMNAENQIAVTSFFGTQNISTTASGGYDYGDDSQVLQTWTSVNTFVDAENLYNNGTNYEAGLLSARDLFNQVSNNGHKKVMVFISDGVPTFYIDDNGNRQGTGVYSNQTNVNNCREPSKAAYAEFVAVHPDVTTYTIGVSKDINGTSLETSISPDVLKYMSGEDRFFGVTTYSEMYAALEAIITNDIGFFHPLLIDDTLSEAVELSEDPDFKATMRSKDGTLTVLYENNQITAAGQGVVQKLTYDAASRTVSVLFTPDYRMEFNSLFELSFNVTTTATAYEEYAQNQAAGLDGYGGVTGDADTDYPGNGTSSGKPGFRSNRSANLMFELRDKEYTMPYDHPVVQAVSCGLNIKKVSMTGSVELEAAEFDLYRKAAEGENGVTLYTLENQVYGEPNSFVKINTEPLVTDESGMVSVTTLSPGEYYLVETKAPEGYNALDEPRKIILTRTSVKTPTGDAMLEGSTVSVGELPTVTVKNSDGFALPETGGQGTTLYTLGGIALMASALLLYMQLKRRREETSST